MEKVLCANERIATTSNKGIKVTVKSVDGLTLIVLEINNKERKGG